VIAVDAPIGLGEPDCGQETALRGLVEVVFVAVLVVEPVEVQSPQIAVVGVDFTDEPLPVGALETVAVGQFGFDGGAHGRVPFTGVCSQLSRGSGRTTTPSTCLVALNSQARRR